MKFLRLEAPTEIDHYRPDIRCFNYHKKRHLATKCKIKKINSVQKDRQTDGQYRQPGQSDRLHRQPDKRQVIAGNLAKEVTMKGNVGRQGKAMKPIISPIIRKTKTLLP